MCRMFGLVAPRAAALGPWLSDREASLKTLSIEHADGWGLASHDGEAWTIEKRTACAAQCPRFTAVARDLRSTLVIAHVRKATVGATALTNTHPFVRGEHAFAHNGTIPRAGDVLGARTSSARAAEIEGQTDSERFFAFLLTRLDERGDAERAVVDAVREIRSIPDFGSASFLFSDGATLFAYRQGRSLFSAACDRAGVTLIASEPLGESTWLEVDEGALLAVDAATGAARPLEPRASRAAGAAGLALRAG